MLVNGERLESRSEHDEERLKNLRQGGGISNTAEESSLQLAVWVGVMASLKLASNSHG